RRPRRGSSDFARVMLMTRFYRAGKAGATEPGRRRERGARRGARGEDPGPGPSGSLPKDPFNIDEVFRRLRSAVKGLPKAAMFDLRDQGYGTPFEQLVGS